MKRIVHYSKNCYEQDCYPSRRESVLSGETFGLIVEEKGASFLPFTGGKNCFILEFSDLVLITSFLK
jgi:hypothetical protein